MAKYIALHNVRISAAAALLLDQPSTSVVYRCLYTVQGQTANQVRNRFKSYLAEKDNAGGKWHELCRPWLEPKAVEQALEAFMEVGIAAIKYPKKELRVHAVALKEVPRNPRLESLICTLPRPARHCDIFKWMRAHKLPKPVGATQGFILNNGQFVDRVEAAKIAVAAGQLGTRTLCSPPSLYSEDLW